jgi:hypothetical protein
VDGRWREIAGQHSTAATCRALCDSELWERSGARRAARCASGLQRGGELSWGSMRRPRSGRAQSDSTRFARRLVPLTRVPQQLPGRLCDGGDAAREPIESLARNAIELLPDRMLSPEGVIECVEANRSHIC